MKVLQFSDAEKVIPLPNGNQIVLVSYERLASEADKQRNIFMVDKDGVVQWQVAEYLAMPGNSTFTNIEVRCDDLFAYNWNGGMYRLDPSTGLILSSELVR